MILKVRRFEMRSLEKYHKENIKSLTIGYPRLRLITRFIEAYSQPYATLNFFTCGI